MRIYIASVDGRSGQTLDTLASAQLMELIADISRGHYGVDSALSDGGPPASASSCIDQARIILSLREQGAPI